MNTLVMVCMLAIAAGAVVGTEAYAEPDMREKTGLAEKDPSILLEKMQMIAAKAKEMNPDADYTEIDSLLATASQQIKDGQDDEALDTLRDIKMIIKESRGEDWNTGSCGEGRYMDGRDGMSYEQKDPSVLLEKMQMFVERIKKIDVDEDYSHIDSLLTTASQQIADGQDDEALNTLQEARMELAEFRDGKGYLKERVGHEMFLGIVERHQEEIRPQIADAPEETKVLFAKAEQSVAALEQAVADGDAEAAKESFKAAMMAFSEISGEKWQDMRGKMGLAGKDPSMMLEKMQMFTAKAKEMNPDADYTEIDSLLATASEQIAGGQNDEALDTLRAAKMIIKESRGEDWNTGSCGEGRYMDGHDGMSYEQKDPSVLLEKMQMIAAKAKEMNPDADHSEIDSLLATASQQIKDGQDDEALDTLRDIKMIIKESRGEDWHMDGRDGMSYEQKDPAKLLEKMQMFVERIKKIDVDEDYSHIDSLFAIASEQIADGQDDEALNTLQEARMELAEFRDGKGYLKEHVGHEMFLRIAEHLQEKVRSQIDDAPEETKILFARAEQSVAALKQAVADGDAEAGKESFEAAMMAFNEIIGEEAHQLHDDDEPGDLSGLVERMRAYAGNLETAAKKHGTTADFAEIKGLLATASEQIADGQNYEALDTLRDAKNAIKAVHAELKGGTSERDSERSLAYAAKYMERLDEMIADAEERGMAGDAIGQLRADLDSARETFEMIKQRAADGEHDTDELIRELAKQLRGIKAALGS